MKKSIDGLANHGNILIIEIVFFNDFLKLSRKMKKTIYELFHWARFCKLTYYTLASSGSFDNVGSLFKFTHVFPFLFCDFVNHINIHDLKMILLKIFLEHNKKDE